MKILDELGVKYEIKDYIKEPLDQSELKSLAGKMGLNPKDFIRTRESIFKELHLKEYLDDDKILLEKMSEFPKLIERPIIVKGDKAILGRPPENIIEFLKS